VRAPAGLLVLHIAYVLPCRVGRLQRTKPKFLLVTDTSCAIAPLHARPMLKHLLPHWQPWPIGRCRRIGGTCSLRARRVVVLNGKPVGIFFRALVYRFYSPLWRSLLRWYLLTQSHPPTCGALVFLSALRVGPLLFCWRSACPHISNLPLFSVLLHSQSILSPGQIQIQIQIRTGVADTCQTHYRQTGPTLHA
jgi:hypothetical protein